jgi:hypothetical protein
VSTFTKDTGRGVDLYADPDATVHAVSSAVRRVLTITSMPENGTAVRMEVPRRDSNREITRALVGSEKTVKTHVSNLFIKLGVQDHTQAALYAVRHGLADDRPAN